MVDRVILPLCCNILCKDERCMLRSSSSTSCVQNINIERNAGKLGSTDPSRTPQPQQIEFQNPLLSSEMEHRPPH